MSVSGRQYSFIAVNNHEEWEKTDLETLRNLKRQNHQTGLDKALCGPASLHRVLVVKSTPGEISNPYRMLCSLHGFFSAFGPALFGSVGVFRSRDLVSSAWSSPCSQRRTAKEQNIQRKASQRQQNKTTERMVVERRLHAYLWRKMVVIQKPKAQIYHLQSPQFLQTLTEIPILESVSGSQPRLIAWLDLLLRK